MHAALSHEFKFPPLSGLSAETVEFHRARNAGMVFGFGGLDFLTLPATPENDDLLGEYCLLSSLCDRYGYRLKGACILDRGPCPFITHPNGLIGFEYLPSPERFWLRDDFGNLNPIPVDSKLACVLREAFNEQLLEAANATRFRRDRRLPGVVFNRVNPEIREAA